MNDTSPEAQHVLIGVYRGMSIDQKWRMLADMYRTAKMLAEAGLRQRNPQATESEIRNAWLAVTLPPSILDSIRLSQDG